MTELKVTVLVENSVGAPVSLVAEWGLAMLLDFGDERILFDSGEQGHLVQNANSLGVDLRAINRLVLSHGHYDHTGGLVEFLKVHGEIPIYAHPELFSAHYHHDDAQDKRYIGVPFRQEQLESMGARFQWAKEPMELRPGLWLSGQIPRQTAFEQVDSHMIQFRDGESSPDPLFDDISMYYATDKGLIVFLGCAHSGLVNIIEHGKKLTGESRIRAIIGGTHLGPASTEQQEMTIEYLHSLNLSCLAPNHCTGLPLLGRLSVEFPDQFRWAAAGTVLEFLTSDGPSYKIGAALK